jgi:hypothetical protein
MKTVTELLPSIITICGILVGIWQFNKGQKDLQSRELAQREFEAVAKFKELQIAKYNKATEVISNIISADDYTSAEFKNSLKIFWQFYWVELSAVEDQPVESAMVKLGDVITALKNKNFEDVTEREKQELSNAGYGVAQAIKKSAKSWEFPK